ncbi:MAG TPA: FAD-dependent monooxygenase [Actinomycetospora sp.]|uniref:FAD-dependent monooxygenase n=1 Tax=Actinomycetospora sp. TaxID=1872135 RepID=UPI002F400CB0
MDLPTRTTVLVSGAGPVGLALATRLAAGGVDHVVVDQAVAGANTSRAAVVHARTLEVLDTLGLAEPLIDRGVVVPRFAVRDRDETLLAIDFSGLATRFPYTLMAPQDITEELLEADLQRRGSGVLREHTLEKIDVVGDAGVRVLVEGPAGPREITADYVVGADGMHSPVRELAGIGFAGSAYPQSFVLADVELDWPLPRTEVQLFFSPEGLVVVAPLPGGRHRVVATVDEAPEHPGIDDIAGLLASRGPRPAAAVRSLAWSSRFRVHHRLAEHYRRGPVFLAGDAAHVHSPAGGQGMNTGIQDAVDLGSRLSAVLTEGADPSLLDGYERDRRPVARQVVALTDRMTRAATLSGPAARVRNVVLRGLGALPPVRRAAAMNLSELRWPSAL